MKSKIRTGKLKTRKPRAGRHNHEGVHEKEQRDTQTTYTYKILRRERTGENIAEGH